MRNKLNEGIISAIKNRLGDNELITPFLMDLLFFGKEAIYRRLRGDVIFTFDEVAAISSRLGFSMDTLAGLKQSERVFFEGDLYQNLSTEEAYYNILLGYSSFLTEVSKSKVVTGLFLHNHFPFVFSIYFETLSKFRYYKFMHQSNAFENDCLMSQITVPPKIVELEKKMDGRS